MKTAPIVAGVLIIATGGLAPGIVAGVCDNVAPVSGEGITLELVSSQITSPLDLVAPPGDTGRIFVAEKVGRIRVIDLAGDALRSYALRAAPFLDIRERVQTDGDRGLMSVAFHPDYAANGYLFIHYSNTNGDLRVSRFERSAANPELADPATEKLLLEYPHPLSNHSGGKIAFGPLDGYLYLTSGDGGRQHDPTGNAQNPLSFLGKILRIDVDSGDPYAVPPDNPFVGQAGVLEEIWSLGLRNPWRIAFDAATGDLFIADVGQDTWEEISFQAGGVPGGQNYEWNFREGDHPHTGASMSIGSRVTSLYDYQHGNGSLHGCSVTGGEVYRGCSMPDLRGRYFFADYCNNWVASLRVQDGTAVDIVDHTTALRAGIAPASLGSIAAFGADGRGEIYLLALPSSIYRIIPETPINHRPVARIAATPDPANLVLQDGRATILLDGAASDDGDGGTQTLAYAWKQTAGSAAQILSPDAVATEVVLTAKGLYRFQLTVNDGMLSAQVLLEFTLQDRPPVPEILAPLADSSFDAGAVIEIQGRAVDPEDGDLPGDRLRWDVILHHEEHTHPWAEGVAGAATTLTIPTEGFDAGPDEEWSFEIVLTATDSQGQEANVHRLIALNYFPIEFRSEPAGLGFTVEGVPLVGPAVYRAVRGATLLLSAPSLQGLPEGATSEGGYVFSNWSDGGEATHEATAAEGLTITAVFAPDPAAVFLRGDSNRDGKTDVSDAVHSFNHLFLGGAPILCPDAADANDSGTVDISDPISTLGALFGAAGPLPEPYAAPGFDPTPDGLGCAR